jgi:hypothetical protein
MAINPRRNPSGPLRSTKLVQYIDVLFWTKTDPPEVKPRDDDEEYIVRQYDYPDVVSGRFFGTTRAAHAIMLRNEDGENDVQMRLWPNDFYQGRRLQIPTQPSLRERDVL